MKIEKGSLNARTFYLPPFFTYQDKAAAQESLMRSMLKDKTIKKERKKERAEQKNHYQFQHFQTRPIMVVVAVFHVFVS